MCLFVAIQTGPRDFVLALLTSLRLLICFSIRASKDDGRRHFGVAFPAQNLIEAVKRTLHTAEVSASQQGGGLEEKGGRG